MDFQTIIHFVGLCVLTTQPVGPERAQSAATARTALAAPTQVVIVMPRVPEQPYDPTANPTRVASVSTRHRLGEVVEPLPTTQIDVEPHTAMLLFEHWYPRTSSGWTISPLNDTYDYVRLNGEQISFIADGPNERARIPKSLGHLEGTLRDDYRPPGYKAAAAVFNIPKGRIGVCISAAVSVHGRRDTQLLLNNSGTITIRSGSKSLQLPGDAVLYAANVPMGYAAAHELHPGEGYAANHLIAYCRMTGTFGDCKMPRLDAEDCKRLTSGDPDPCPSCLQNDMRVGHTARTRKGSAIVKTETLPPPPVELASFECSNTQWP
jgi:hypothetical protein